MRPVIVGQSLETTASRLEIKSPPKEQVRVLPKAGEGRPSKESHEGRPPILHVFKRWPENWERGKKRRPAYRTRLSFSGSIRC